MSSPIDRGTRSPASATATAEPPAPRKHIQLHPVMSCSLRIILHHPFSDTVAVDENTTLAGKEGYLGEHEAQVQGKNWESPVPAVAGHYVLSSSLWSYKQPS